MSINIEEIIKLENKIEWLRNQMNTNGKLNGLNHSETLKYSQELDHCLNKYHQVSSNPK
ncbi:aspartyl-phosphate phosphatase Spo0E family protein [Alkalihalobacterium alkalinitrilicum]|uniref:aspartyl-phosphate phosphatase Spo0E family protein n=1 Tax=Alkalihalobacterium alkalinitrilicum TaxID=427920 RepID=UPI0009959D8A|nr:aspartyl-phosphate phosphatase Spo0E family protein [Alkalihalobacterium alkalinitrilicum]